MKQFKVALIDKDAKMPVKADGDMCFDVFSVENKEVRFGAPVTVRTGIKIEPPEDFHYSVRPRSGLAVKHGIDVLAGQIDNSYRGELIVVLSKNTNAMFFPSKEVYNIKKGDKIAQIKFEKDYGLEPVEVKEEELSKTVRNDGKFGSTGR